MATTKKIVPKIAVPAPSEIPTLTDHVAGIKASLVAMNKGDSKHFAIARRIITQGLNDKVVDLNIPAAEVAALLDKELPVDVQKK